MIMGSISYRQAEEFLKENMGSVLISFIVESHPRTVA